jgi:hypothetical protein
VDAHSLWLQAVQELLWVGLSVPILVLPRFKKVCREVSRGSTRKLDEDLAVHAVDVAVAYRTEFLLLMLMSVAYVHHQSDIVKVNNIS